MEADRNQNSTDQTNIGEGITESSWVSPEVLAAREGEQVEFGSTLVDQPGNDD